MDEEILQEARRYAFLLLKYRLRSEKELCWRLKQKKFTPPVVLKTVAFLKDRGFLNDREFARGWVSSRAKRPLGPRRLRQELLIKGVDPEIINDELQRLQDSLPESEVARQAALARLAKMRGSDPLNNKRRVYGYLLRRGFSPTTAAEVLENI